MTVKKTLEDMTVDELLAIDHTCSVCAGFSPKWDGHDKNPPCQGAAEEEIVRRARMFSALMKESAALLLIEDLT